MRVVAGRARGRRLVAPSGDGTRPTSDHVREAIFNILQSLVEWEGLAVADLFAGSGAMGIEALSRGAGSCVFVERDRRALDAIRANLAVTKLAEGARVEVVQRDAVGWAAAGASADVVFADPPYEFDEWAALAAVDAALVVAESDREVDLGERWRILKSKRYGSTVVTLFEPRSEPL